MSSYFKRANLPDPKGPTSSVVPSVSIIAANKVVEELRKKERVVRGTYLKLTEEQKAEIAKLFSN